MLPPTSTQRLPYTPSHAPNHGRLQGLPDPITWSTLVSNGFNSHDLDLWLLEVAGTDGQAYEGEEPDRRTTEWGSWYKQYQTAKRILTESLGEALTLVIHHPQYLHIVNNTPILSIYTVIQGILEELKAQVGPVSHAYGLV